MFTGDIRYEHNLINYRPIVVTPPWNTLDAEFKIPFSGNRAIKTSSSPLARTRYQRFQIPSAGNRASKGSSSPLVGTERAKVPDPLWWKQSERRFQIPSGGNRASKGSRSTLVGTERAKVPDPLWSYQSFQLLNLEKLEYCFTFFAY